MTHDELLAKINKGGAYAFEIDSYGWLALKSIAELHHPLYYRKGAIETKGAHCTECSKGSHGENAVEYPCPTIQAIEGQLK